jgi:hypothetical protein
MPRDSTRLDQLSTDVPRGSSLLVHLTIVGPTIPQDD